MKSSIEYSQWQTTLACNESKFMKDDVERYIIEAERNQTLKAEIVPATSETYNHEKKCSEVTAIEINETEWEDVVCQRVERSEKFISAATLIQTIMRRRFCMKAYTAKRAKAMKDMTPGQILIHR
eukprot:10709032-Ditylum_brightwellii.AAC.1